MNVRIAAASMSFQWNLAVLVHDWLLFVELLSGPIT